MEYYRTVKTGERVYISYAKRFPSQPDAEIREMIYRVRDGHALWGYTRSDIILETEWLKAKTLSRP